MSKVLEDSLRTLAQAGYWSSSRDCQTRHQDEGSVMLSDQGAIQGDDVADVTLKASEQVFRDILAGTQNPAMAFMSGKLKVDGSNMRALKVSEILTSDHFFERKSYRLM